MSDAKGRRGAGSTPRVTRRQMLAAGAALAAAGALGRGAHWWLHGPDSPYDFLSQREADLVDALGEAMFPPGGEPAISGAEVGLAAFMDQVLFHMPEPLNRALRTLLQAIDDWARLSSFSGYVELPLEERTARLESWLRSDNALLRGALTGLTIFLAEGYTGHPEVIAAAGWVFPCGFER